VFCSACCNGAVCITMHQSQCVHMCYNVLHSACCSVLQCVAVCGTVASPCTKQIVSQCAVIENQRVHIRTLVTLEVTRIRSFWIRNLAANHNVKSRS